MPARGQRREWVARARQLRHGAREARRARQAPVIAVVGSSGPPGGQQAQREHVARGAQVLESGRAALAQLVGVPVLQQVPPPWFSQRMAPSWLLASSRSD